ncbi:hypothetical protein C2U72_01740 [Prosthecomicrobium hirschii]|nr:hypothetical protein C2U72_01740 [Prosthecomicrobium hirschii]
MDLCALCSRQSRGFGFCLHLRFDRYPDHRFCSQACLKAGIRLARRSNGMIDKTPMERQAIRDARQPLAEVLGELGLLAAFQDRSAGEIDRLIEACIDGFQASMRAQADAGVAPF